ncbi:MAG TPA: polysaccharide biosynthesis/export family protein, partial [Pyrinomonadaceae bacterium]|nr:polysaccharide biosynthesis/export family protein [Pyrinomonadaceae bacterium]
MKVIRLLSLLAVSCACAAVAFAQQPQAPAANGLVSNTSAETPPAPGSDVAPYKYLLGPGDVLDLRVFNEPQFSDKLQVSDEGVVTVPFVGEIPARCRTDVDVRKDIAKALTKYLKNPQISLRITELKSRPPAVVFGAVRDPARFEMRRRVRLLDLLAASGGVTEQASGDIQIFHTEPELCPGANADEVAQQAPSGGVSVEGAFTLYKLADLKLGKPEGNPPIRPGDIVIVTEAKPVYLTGAVNNPTGIYLRDKLTLTRAVAMVGGPRKGAKTSEVRIYRLKPNTQEPELIKVDFDAIRKQKQPDFYLEPYDVVEVQEEGGFKKGVLDLLRGGVVPTLTQGL